MDAGVAVGLAFLASFLIVWMLTSFAVFAAGRMMAGERATFAKASILILVGAVLLGVAYIVTSILFTPFFGWVAAFLLWLGLIKYFFGTGWVAAFIISILAWVIFIILALALMVGLALLGFHLPKPGPVEELLPAF